MATTKPLGTFLGFEPATKVISNQTANYTVVASDLGKIINCTANSFTVSLTAAATLGAGFNCWIWNTTTTSTDVITIDPNASETVDGVATISLRRGEGCQIICDGTNWQVGGQKELRGYSENGVVTSPRPISGNNAIALGFGSGSSPTTASGITSFAVGGTNAAGATASGIASIALHGVASANYSTAIGVNSNNLASQAVTGAGAMALGGSYASGVDSFAAAVGNNTSNYGALGDGSIAIGSLNRTSGLYSVAFGGGYNSATANYSFAHGYYSTAAQYGKKSWASGTFASSGDAQNGKMVLRGAVTDATPKVLTSNNGAPTTNNQVVLSSAQLFAFRIQVAARQSVAVSDTIKMWEIKGAIKRSTTSATTSIVGTPVIDTIAADAGAANWTIAVSADTTNGALALTFTGEAAKNIRVVATVETTEVVYA